MYKFSSYWTDKLKVDFLQRVILIHSYLYYQLSRTKWSDKQYDEASKQLVGLQSKHNKQWVKQTQYGYVFYDFDGTTGFDLWHRLSKEDQKQISSIAKSL